MYYRERKADLFLLEGFFNLFVHPSNFFKNLSLPRMMIKRLNEILFELKN